MHEKTAGQQCPLSDELGKRLELIDPDVFKFCWIVDFPMYELDDDGKVEFSHNPFSMPQGGMKDIEEKDPLDILAWQYDLVCNGIELSSGAIRNHRPEIMYKAFEIAGYGPEDMDVVQAYDTMAPAELWDIEKLGFCRNGEAPGLLKEGKSYQDEKSLYPDYTTYEELWACTTCNACAYECPVNIDHVSIILDLRKYMVLEKAIAA